MLRLAEIALLLAPFGAFVAWRVLMPEGAPSRPFLVGLAALLVVMAALLAWLSRENTLAPGALYIPPHVEDGVIVPGHGVPLPTPGDTAPGGTTQGGSTKGGTR